MPTDQTSFTVRIATEIHERLARVAAGNVRSLNAEVVARLAGSLEPQRNGADRALQVLELPRVVRFEESSTSQSVYALLTVCRELGADAITFAAREDRLNHAVLVAIVQTPALLAVMDTSWLNMARDPRLGEVEALFKALDGMGLLATARACRKFVPDTTALSAPKAVEAILEAGEPEPLDLRRYLNLLSGHGLFDVARFQVASAVPAL